MDASPEMYLCQFSVALEELWGAQATCEFQAVQITVVSFDLAEKYGKF